MFNEKFSLYFVILFCIFIMHLWYSLKSEEIHAVLLASLYLQNIHQKLVSHLSRQIKKSTLCQYRSTLHAMDTLHKYYDFDGETTIEHTYMLCIVRWGWGEEPVLNYNDQELWTAIQTLVLLHPQTSEPLKFCSNLTHSVQITFPIFYLHLVRHPCKAQ